MGSPAGFRTPRIGFLSRVVVSEPSPPAPGPSTTEPTAEPIAELIELGQRLRRAREGRGIGVAELADRLHLGPEQLTALENGDHRHLHEPVFVIAQAKRVAQALGVDVSRQVEDLRHSRLMQSPSPGTPAPSQAATGAVAPDPDDAEARSAAPLGWPLALALAALTLLVGMVGLRSFQLWKQRRPAPAAAVAPGVLLLRSDQPSWVEVRDRSEHLIFNGTIEKEARFRLGYGLQVRVRRPELITATIGGQAPRRLKGIPAGVWQEFATPGLISPPPPLPPLPQDPSPAPAP
jgi:cytoskeleton protein RodZ